VAIGPVRRPALAAMALAACAATWSACASGPDFDLIIRGGTVYDGTGETVGIRRVDVGVKGDRILAIGDLGARSAADVIDATGKVVSPGFIDAQSRSGVSLLANGFGDSHLRQGITSEILADGGPALWTAATADTAALERNGLTLDWSGLSGYFAKLESHGTAINVGTLIPLSLARAAGDSAAFIDAAMRDGAFGLVDDVNAAVPDLVAAATVAGRYDGMVMNHADSAVAQSDDAVLAVGAQAHRLVIAGLSQAPADHPASEMIGRMLRAAPRNVFVYGSLQPYAPAAGEPEAVMRETVKFGGALIATDTGAVKDSAADSDTHPAAFGAFPRLLGPFVRDAHLIELREAVRRATSAPASVFQIPQRGIIRETYFADLVVFDAGTIADRATFERPNQYPVGIEYVIVNGVVEVTPRGLTGSRSGSRLVHRLPAR
jgi:N-acyl-D-amino-acid deacylase